MLERETCDVFITTPHAKLPPRLAKRRFHRIVFDQSHQYEPCSGSSVATARNNTTNYLGTLAWCVSSEPCATRLEQLETQAAKKHKNAAQLAHEAIHGEDDDVEDEPDTASTASGEITP